MKMRLIALLLLVSMVALPSALHAQGKTDPESVIRAICTALEEKNVDAAIALVADDVVQTLVPAPPGATGVYTGKEQLRARFKEVIAVNARHTFGSFQVDGDKATFTATYVDDTLPPIGIDSLEFTGEAVVQNGLLKSITWTLTEQSLAKLQAAAAKTLPETGGVAFPGYAAVIALGALALAGGLGVRWLRRYQH